MACDQRGSEVTSHEECRRLLELAGASGEVGRLGVNREGPPYIIPVNFSFCDDQILIRLGPGFAAYHLNGETVTFEIDHVEPYAKQGWSVAAQGTARLLPYEEVARLGRNVPRPIVLYPGMRVFSIRPDVISGRSVRHDHEDRRPPSSKAWPHR
jgi:nitroimidazol reductase NimA-like FMN-containing flavoprotein (pyridoxamine 5'-phosphate oxidase superfamily)